MRELMGFLDENARRVQVFHSATEAKGKAGADSAVFFNISFRARLKPGANNAEALPHLSRIEQSLQTAHSGAEVEKQLVRNGVNFTLLRVPPSLADSFFKMLTANSYRIRPGAGRKKPFYEKKFFGRKLD
ncbi:hypothetical protein HY993_03795 [Candidatus Micrarchaeota archaeon]|nr:hypothetical protein [Candidatus Micrarchaeota archaeon]